MENVRPLARETERERSAKLVGECGEWCHEKKANEQSRAEETADVGVEQPQASAYKRAIQIREFSFSLLGEARTKNWTSGGYNAKSRCIIRKA
jgi:hypothetical protein